MLDKFKVQLLTRVVYCKHLYSHSLYWHHYYHMSISLSLSKKVLINNYQMHLSLPINLSIFLHLSVCLVGTPSDTALLVFYCKCHRGERK